MRVTTRQLGTVTLVFTMLGAGVVAGVGVGEFPGSTDHAAAAPAQGPQTLQIIPAGPGTVKYTPTGQNPSFGCNTDGPSQVAQGNNAFSAIHCEQTYEPNQTVTLEAIPRPTGPQDEGRVYSFVGWSADECAGKNPCQLVMPDGPLTISAIFSPAEFGVFVTDSNTGDASVTATASPAGKALTCTKEQTPACRGWYAAGTELTLTANPGSGKFNSWHRNCEGTDRRCVVTTAGYGWANAEFNDAGAADIPDRIPARVNVVVGGASGGKVVSSRSPNFGDAVDCPPTCNARFYLGEPVTLTASGTAQLSTWGGACPGAASTCRIYAGVRNPVRATFQASQVTTTQASTTQVTTTQVTTTTKTTGTTIGRTEPARLVSVAVGSQRGQRKVVATLLLQRRFVGRISLVRGGRSLGSKQFKFGPGRHRLTLVLRRGVRPGWTSLRLTLRDARGRVVTLRRPVRLR